MIMIVSYTMYDVQWMFIALMVGLQVLALSFFLSPLLCPKVLSIQVDITF